MRRKAIICIHKNKHQSPGGEAYSSRDIAVGTLYVQKEALGEPAPQRLRVTIEEDD